MVEAAKKAFSEGLDHFEDEHGPGMYARSARHLRLFATGIDEVVNGTAQDHVQSLPSVASAITQSILSEASDMERTLLRSIDDQIASLERTKQEVKNICAEMRRRGASLGDRITEHSTTTRNISEAVRKARLGLNIVSNTDG